MIGYFNKSSLNTDLVLNQSYRVGQSKAKAVISDAAVIHVFEKGGRLIFVVCTVTLFACY